MRNKRNVQRTLGEIEAIQSSFIQFIRNTKLTEGERTILERQMDASKQAFEQMRTFLNQEDEEYNTPVLKAPQYNINSGRF